jgi:ribosomal protein S18 acetylase RimI-like enzyme
MKIIKCNENSLKEAAALFNAYRIFYEQSSDFDACYAFLKNNLTNNNSLIFLMFDGNDAPIAFSQLYPSFCSVEMKPIYYLYDLYVDEASRGKSYGKYLMNYIIEYCKSQNIKRITLDTANTNKIAQNLYESIGYEKESEFIAYHYRY